LEQQKKGEPMSKSMPEEVIKTARENVEAFTAGDWQRLKAVLSSDVIYDEIGGNRRLQGADQMLEAYKE